MIDLGPNPLAWLRENVPPSSLRRTRPSRRAGMQRKWNASTRASRPRRGVCLSSGVVRDIGAAVTWLNDIWRIAGTEGMGTQLDGTRWRAPNSVPSVRSGWCRSLPAVTPSRSPGVGGFGSAGVMGTTAARARDRGCSGTNSRSTAVRL